MPPVRDTAKHAKLLCQAVVAEALVAIAAVRNRRRLIQLPQAPALHQFQGAKIHVCRMTLPEAVVAEALVAVAAVRDGGRFVKLSRQLRSHQVRGYGCGEAKAAVYRGEVRQAEELGGNRRHEAPHGAVRSAAPCAESCCYVSRDFVLYIDMMAKCVRPKSSDAIASMRVAARRAAAFTITDVLS